MIGDIILGIPLAVIWSLTLLITKFQYTIGVLVLVGAWGMYLKKVRKEREVQGEVVRAWVFLTFIEVVFLWVTTPKMH